MDDRSGVKRLSDRRLEVALRHRIGGLALEVEFTLTAPWTVLFAPSGAGKSTVLRVIAGLVRPDAGRIVSLGTDRTATVMTDTANGVFVPAHRRAVRFVGQQTALFPHRTVRQNVAYGMANGAEAEQVMKLCRIAHLAEKRPSAISGGERQRVALARALGATPARMLLLDEPFTGIDVTLRDELMREIVAWPGLRDTPVLHVTHDVGEVFAAAAEVIRMQDGRVVAQGPAAEVLGLERQRLLDQLGASQSHPPR